ncbi:MAG: BrnA antitoxin family protein [candidate division KSB1 bacterium]|nr:BrnA antitoxin family protein [candidate division KSB1 bacterium]
MNKNKTSISKASSYKEIGEYWDSHDVTEVWDKTRKVKFDVEIESEVIYYPLEKSLSEKVRSLAKKHGITSETLINLWVQEKLQEQVS